ncbi:MAG TPA: glycerophosphodiester phosphodiesterase [Geminicoccaceae bacterium]
MLDLPRIIGHRGAAAEAPENTLASIRAAHAAGTRMVEFDVKLTADDEPVLLHDDRLERTTDGRGPVRERSLEEVRALDAGGWFDRRFAGERVPHLDQAIALCLELGLRVNVEIKPCPGREVRTAEVTLERLRAIWPAAAPAPLVSSFEEAALEVARDRQPDWPRGYLCEALAPDWQARLARLGCATLNLGWRRLSRSDVATLRAAGVPLLVYTVNDVDRARRLLAWGVSALFTDTVGSLIRAGLDRPAPRPAQ